MQTVNEPILIINDANGIYIGQCIAQNWINEIENREELKRELSILAIGPDHDDYLDAWQDVEDKAVLILDGHKYSIGTIEDSGDRWAIPEGYEFPEG